MPGLVVLVHNQLPSASGRRELRKGSKIMFARLRKASRRSVAVFCSLAGFSVGASACHDSGSRSLPLQDADGITVHSGALTTRIPWAGQGRNPCLARNPIALVGPLAVEPARKQGHRQNARKHHPFTMAATANACLTVTIAGKHSSSLELRVDDARFVIRSRPPFCKSKHGHHSKPPIPDPLCETEQTFDLPLRLAAGPHAVRITDEDLTRGGRATIRVFAQGPAIHSVAPIIAAPGDKVTLSGEGLLPTIKVDVGGMGYAVSSVSAAEDLIVVDVPARSPVAPFHVSTPMGQSGATTIFTPVSTSGLLGFYPFADFAIADSGTCVSMKRFRLLQDGGRLSFVVDFHRALPPDIDLSIQVDDNNDPTTVEIPLRLTRAAALETVSGVADVLGAVDAATMVISSTFAALDLHDPEKLGRMFVRLGASSGCGTATHPSSAPVGTRESFLDIRSAFAPGILIIRSSKPVAVAARHGLQFLATAENSDLSTVGLPPARRLQDVLIELAGDPEVNGVIPDPVLFPAAHVPARVASCARSTTPSLLEPVFEALDPMPPNPMAGLARAEGQWSLGQIGMNPMVHPSPMIGAGIVVAVLDGGVTGHPDVTPNLLPGFDLSPSGDGTTTDVLPGGGHGTGVASLIAGVQGNGGMVGVAPGASILPFRVLNRMGVGDGFGLYRAFGRIIALKSPAMNIQVVNVSMQEFIDTILVGTGFLSDLSVLVGLPPGLGPWLFATGVATNAVLHGRAGALVGTGTALVVAAGNSGGAVWGSAGMQYPANVAGAFAVAELDSARAPTPSSTTAAPGQTIALSAPAQTTTGDGIVMASASGGFRCSQGTSFSAPLVSGAIAHLLAPSAPAVALASGNLAGQKLVSTARALSATPDRVGAGEVNLALALTPPPLTPFLWGTGEFESGTGSINDIAFVTGVGDFVLRNFGTEIEGIAGPGAPITTSISLSAAHDWMVGVEGVNRLVVGNSAGISVYFVPGGTKVGSLNTPSFRPAVSPFMIGSFPLVVTADGSGGARIRLGASMLNSSNLAVIGPAFGGNGILGVAWAGSPVSGAAANEPFVLAVRELSSVTYYRIPAQIEDCPTTPTACPTFMGRGPVPATVGGMGEWAITAGALGPTAYFVNGTSTVFVVPMGGPVVTLPAGTSRQFRGLAANPRKELVYVVDQDNSSFTLLRGATTVSVDDSRANQILYQGWRLRVAPDGTYGYLPANLTRLQGPNNPSLSFAVWVGGL